MIHDTYFEVGGVIYSVNTPSVANIVSHRYIQQRCYPITSDWRKTSFPDPLPWVEPRWDSTQEKRDQARRDYGMSGPKGSGLPRFPGWFG